MIDVFDPTTRRGLLLVALWRLVEGLFLVQTFFSPDEFWQSTEVAYDAVFGGGYLTWEWRPWAQIRGFLHPLMFAVPYAVLARFGLDSRWMIIWLPRILQSLLLVVQDVYFFKTARVVLKNPPLETAAMMLHLTSWFVGFCGVRTLSNSLEAICTTVALFYWISYSFTGSQHHPTTYAKALFVTGLCFVLRPTSAVLWIAVVIAAFVRAYRHSRLTTKLLSYTLLIGGFWFVASMFVDYLFYRTWTFVPWNFVYFNVAKNFSALYGVHPFHWYFSNALPTLFGSYIVLFVLGLYFLRELPSSLPLRRWTFWGPPVWTIFVYSLLGHKEFRFIYPLLPVYGFTLCSIALYRLSRFSRLLFSLLVLSQLGMLFFFGIVHQRGVLSATHWVANRIEAKPIENRPTVVDFLTPCHHAPFKTYFHRLNAKLDFLTCDPSVEPGFVPADRAFLRDPVPSFEKRYPPGSQLPDFIVAYDALIHHETFANKVLKKHNYHAVKDFFHSFFPNEEHESTAVVVLYRQSP